MLHNLSRRDVVHLAILDVDHSLCPHHQSSTPRAELLCESQPTDDIHFQHPSSPRSRGALRSAVTDGASWGGCSLTRRGSLRTQVGTSVHGAAASTSHVSERDLR
ncbi:hypothetical protein BV898_02057 [Hypsibius exemplaris]|uniref:Uncharacterized protein n=1 Tax=Hypsibius exemplaris TaxID=2072580 RepID=A0A1W0X992_HYPEX|nr:hypothetical protein BV898_02057 [Hypsibius exemplaris]